MAYINTDVCMSGPILEPVASPTLMDILVPATRDIVSPEDESQSYYDYWQQWSGQGDSFNPEVGSDNISWFYYENVLILPLINFGGFLLSFTIYSISLHSTFHRLWDLKVFDKFYRIYRTFCLGLNQKTKRLQQ